jgi:hypothetical protein
MITGANVFGGAGNPSTGETSVGDNAAEIIKVVSGQALVWFDGSFITGISVGPNTSLEIRGDVFGDIIGNLTAEGRLTTPTVTPPMAKMALSLLPNNLTGLKTFALSGGQAGDVRHIITGGSVSNVSVNGELQGIFAGDGSFRALGSTFQVDLVTSTSTVDMNPIVPGVQSSYTVQFTGSTLQAGGSVKGVTVQTGNELQIYSGSGSPTGVAASGQRSGGWQHREYHDQERLHL